jgi:uncharacterized protein involved in outer membrane biogenesis
MTVKSLIQWIAIALAAIVISGLIYLSVADLGWLKPRIESAVSDATGREFSIDGEFSLRALWTPSVVIENARLANAEWGSEPTMLTIGHASGKVDLWSLISGPIRVEELRIADVDVLLESNEQGVSNLDFAPGEEPEPEPAEEDDAEVPLILEFAEIRNVNLTARAPDGRTREISLEKLDVVTDEEQWLAIDGNGSLNDLAFNVDGRIGSLAALAASEDIGVNLKGGLGRLQFSADGTLATLQSIAGSRFDLVATAEDVAPILERLSVDLPLEGPLQTKLQVVPEDSGTNVTFDASAGELSAQGDARFQGREAVEFEFTVPALDRAGAALGIEGLPAGDLAVSGKTKFEKRAIRFEPLRAALGEDELVLNGTVSRDRKQGDELSIDARVASLDALRAGLPPEQLELTASIKRKPGTIALDPLDLKLGETDVKGSVSLDTGAPKALRAKLTSERVDLTPFLGGAEEDESTADAKAEEAKAEEAKAEEAEAEEPPREKMFPDEPLPFDLLRELTIDIESTIARLTLNDGQLNNVETRAKLQDGTLEYESAAEGWGGGTSVARVDMTMPGDSANVAAQIFMRDLKINLFSGEDATPEQVPPVSVTVDIKTAGATPHALAASSNGRVLVTQGPGRIKNTLIGKVSGDLIAQIFSALNPFAKDEEFSNWDCTVFALEIEEGEAAITGMLAQGEKLKIVGGGSIDLDSEKIDIEFNTKPRKGVGVSADMFVTPFVKVSGTLTDPGVGLNEKGVLLAGGAAVATGGLSLLIKGAIDRITGGSDSCEKVIEDVGGHPPVPAE